MTRADRIDWALHLAMTAMPSPLCSAFGARLAPLLGRKANPAADREAAALLAALRPDWAAEPAALAAAMDRLWDCTGRTFAEFAISHRLLKSGRVALAGAGTLDAALSSGRPLIALFPHTGNWELSFMQLAFRAPGRAALIFDPPKTRQARADIAYKVRRQAPFDLFPTSRMVWRKAIAQLAKPGGILITASDEVVDGHVGAPFFSRPLRTDGNLGKVARLALSTGALVVPFYNERHPGPRFTTHVLTPLTFSGAAGDEEAVRAAVSAMDAAMAPPIFRLLDQWHTALLYRHGAGNGWHDRSETP
jgi:lauroyl/myristoyl acyltransferase